MTHGYCRERKAIVSRRRRIEGQVSGGVAPKLHAGHVEHCVTDALATGDEIEAEAKRRELFDTSHGFTRAR